MNITDADRAATARRFHEGWAAVAWASYSPARGAADRDYAAGARARDLAEATVADPRDLNGDAADRMFGMASPAAAAAATRYLAAEADRRRGEADERAAATEDYEAGRAHGRDRPRPGAYAAGWNEGMDRAAPAAPAPAPAWRAPVRHAADVRAALAGARRAELALAAAAAPEVPRPVLEAAHDEMGRDYVRRQMDRRTKVEDLARRARSMAAALEAVAAAAEAMSPDPVPRALRMLGGMNGHWCPGRASAGPPGWANGHRAKCSACWRAAAWREAERALR